MVGKVFSFTVYGSISKQVEIFYIDPTLVATEQNWKQSHGALSYPALNYTFMHSTQPVKADGRPP